MRSDDQLMMARTEYDEHMDDLAGRISASVAGEKCAEVVFACCAVIGFAMSELDRDERAVIHPLLSKFITEVMERCNEQDRLHS
jgi:hypothetical protein